MIILSRRIVPKIQKVIALVVLVILFIAVSWGTVRTFRFMRRTGITPGLIVRLAFDDGIPLKSSDGRINILLLGIGGGTHDGADLTDSMIVLSLSATDTSAAVVSLPRDIWSDTLKDKINSAYHYGEEKKKGGGLILSKVVAEDVIGMPIQYSILFDFSGFKKVIDTLGGIDIAVSQSFTDTEYPTPGRERDSCPGDSTNRCLYETVHFDEGTQHMNGDRALIYARSRHAEGSEGSDFARSRRQQEILVAMKNTILHPMRWLTFARLRALPKVLDDATDTDMNIGELASVGKKFLKIPEFSTQKVVLEPLLTQGPEYVYGRFVLVPKDSWDDVHGYINKQLH